MVSSSALTHLHLSKSQFPMKVSDCKGLPLR